MSIQPQFTSYTGTLGGSPIVKNVQNDLGGFPADYLDTYTLKIGAVETADLQRVGRAYLHPERSTVLVMGDLSTFDKPLSTLGKPQEIKLIDYSQETP